MEEKIISVGADGDICFEDEVLLREYVAEETHRIVKCTAVIERRMRWLRLALLCERQGLEREAVDCFRDALWGVVQLKKGTEEYDICHQAYNGLSRLHNSKDEYVWETASQAIYDVKDLFT